jgi:enoyl-CoA hydratase
MAWDIEGVEGCTVVRMNTSKVNVQNDPFFARQRWTTACLPA